MQTTPIPWPASSALRRQQTCARRRARLHNYGTPKWTKIDLLQRDDIRSGYLEKRAKNRFRNRFKNRSTNRYTSNRLSNRCTIDAQ